MGRKSLTVGDFSRAVARALSEQAEYMGKSQAAIARETGISQNRVNLIMRAERAITVEETRIICEALGISVLSVLRDAEAMWTCDQPADVIDFPHTQEENLPDFTKLAARKVTNRPEWEAIQALNDIGEESQDPGDYED